MGDKNNLNWTDIENRHFAVWLELSFSDNFKKLWGVINDDLTAGSYTVYIENSSFMLIVLMLKDYNESEYQAKK